jgi:acetyl-CoA carboxylase carboxyl transferase subunit beta
MLDRVTPRTALKDELVTIVRLLMGMDAPVKGDLPAPSEADAEPTADADA